MLPGNWLFPDLNPVEPLTPRQFNRAIHAAADAAHIDKRLSMRRQANGMSAASCAR